MCCFSRPIKHVSATQIFARHLDGVRQALVYSMNLEIDEELAMVLPIPVVPGAGEEAVTFVDLSAYPKLFTDLGRAFPEPPSYGLTRGLAPARLEAAATLVVHDVGDFVASFVPTPRDFSRLDKRFQLSPEVFKSRSEYADYGFAVFQLKPRKKWFRGFKPQTIHPMAFAFPSRRPRALFYPTLHVHDGSVPERASFDHSLYCQTDDAVLAKTIPFRQSEGPLGDHVDAERTNKLVDGKLHGYRNVVMHDHPNDDHWYDPPACSGPHKLSGEGELFAFKLSATAAYYTEFGHPPARRWHEAARTKLDALHDALLDGCKTLTAQHRDDWHLIGPRPELEPVWLSNDKVYGSGNEGPTLLEVGKERAVRISVSTDSQDVEPQRVDLAFSRVPSSAVIGEIRQALNAIVARAVV